MDLTSKFLIKPVTASTPFPAVKFESSPIENFEIVGKMLTKYNGNDKNVVIPNGVTTICQSAFAGCSWLIGVIIPDGVTSIGNSAFYGCSLLKSITIPDGVTKIGKYAFEGCGKLKIYCRSGSYAEEYAKRNKIKYESIG